MRFVRRARCEAAELSKRKHNVALANVQKERKNAAEE